MNNSSCSQLDKNLFENTVLPALQILVCFVGLVLNVWGMKSLLHEWKKLHCINILVFNLGVADMLNLLTLPLLIAYYLRKGEWIFGGAFCKVTRFCVNLNLYGSIGFLTCISVYRYLAVVYPIKAMGRITTTHSVVMSAMVWILVGAQSLPDIFFPKHSEENKKQCYDTTDLENVEEYLNYSLSWTFIGFCIPFVLTAGCYGHVTLVICRSDMMTRDLKRQILKLLFFLLVLFLLCYTPYHVFKNLNLYSRVLITQNICSTWNSGVYSAHQVSRGLVSLNNALNPLVYLHLFEEMGTQFRQLLQDGRQMLSYCFRPKSSSVSLRQNEEETANPL